VLRGSSVTEHALAPVDVDAPTPDRRNFVLRTAMINGWKVCALTAVTLLGIVVGGSHLDVASADPPPRMEEALRHLKEAREDLREARSNHGGHRERALDFTDQAIRQVQQGIILANRRDRDDRHDHDHDRDRHDRH
jgi:hypothetical protein